MKNMNYYGIIDDMETKKMGRELPESLKVRQGFVKFIKDDLKLECVSVGIIQKFVNIYTEQVKAKKPDIDNISIYSEAKKIYQADSKLVKMDKLIKLGYSLELVIDALRN